MTSFRHFSQEPQDNLLKIKKSEILEDLKALSFFLNML